MGGRLIKRFLRLVQALSDILELTPETYSERFRHSAIKRAKLAGIKRNARALLEHSREVVSIGD